MNKKISNGMNYIKKNLLKITLIAFALVSPVLSFAQNCSTNPSAPGCETNPPLVTIDNPIGADTINELIKTILEGVIKIGIPIIALAIIYCGFLFVKALGKPEELKKAKDALLYTVIGSAILLGAWTIAQLISDTVLEIGK